MIFTINSCYLRKLYYEAFFYCSDMFVLCETTAFLDAFEKLRKATISFVGSVRPSVRSSAWNNNSDPTGRIFVKFYI
jgi:hypothetical protein